MFIYYPMVLTHGPFINPPGEENAEGDDQEKFKAMVSYADKLTGRLVRALEEMGIRENTIIIWTTDNGSPGGMTGSLNGRKKRPGWLYGSLPLLLLSFRYLSGFLQKI